MFNLKNYFYNQQIISGNHVPVLKGASQKIWLANPQKRKKYKKMWKTFSSSKIVYKRGLEGVLVIVQITRHTIKEVDKRREFRGVHAVQPCWV